MNGTLTMKNGKIDKYLFGGGYAQASVASSTTDNFAFYYYNQDHLGNIREVVNESGTVQQVTNYYPFGAPYADTSAATNADFQPYKYNGKELDKMHGLNTYDYGARQHDPILARWDRIDPLCEKYYDISPYAYCANNPVMYIDPDGKDIYIQYKDNNGKFQTFHFNGFGGKSIKIPRNQFVKDVISAYLYNASDGKMNSMIKAATNSKYKVFVRDATDPDVINEPKNLYVKDSGKHIVTWLSRKGLETTEGGRQSAATGLEHEFDHAVSSIDDPDFKKRANTYNEQYDTEEEKRVIEGSETKTALSHGESVRSNHKGKYYDTTSPISTSKK